MLTAFYYWTMFLPFNTEVDLDLAFLYYKFNLLFYQTNPLQLYKFKLIWVKV